MSKVQELVTELSSERKKAAIRIQAEVLKSISDFMYERDVPQLMPVLLSTLTDPLCHQIFDASLEYYGKRLKLTKSMIIHKQVALLAAPKFFIISPCVRLEEEKTAETGRHRFEFSQLDMEFREWDKWRFMDFTEDLLVHVLEDVIGHCGKELKVLGRRLCVPKKPFKRHESKELAKGIEGGVDAAIDGLSTKSTEPFWVLDHEREFYDREDEVKERYFHNYDLMYPKGFGEALSGGEREAAHERIVKAMQRSGQEPKDYGCYMELAEKGHLKKSAGGGLGIERLVRYCTGAGDIEEVCLFSRKPGKEILL